MPNLLTHYGDFTLAAEETSMSTSSIRRSTAFWLNGGSRVGRSRTFLWWSSLPRLFPEIELHLGGIGKVERLLLVVNIEVSGAEDF